MTHLRQIVRASAVDDTGAAVFPFSVPAIRSLESLDVSANVVYFVGENGSGKSTLLEAIAAGARLPTVGSAEVAYDETLAAQRRLAAAFRLIWEKRTHRGFFLRAEDFFGFARRLRSMKTELRQRMDEVEVEYKDRSALARGLALGPLAGSIHEITRRYGEDLDAQSHGESFLTLFRARFVPGGLYLLDEPEAALSPQSQLALLLMLKQMVAQSGQFIIATHSPMLLAYPGARIYSFDQSPIAEVAWADLDHVTLTRAFLADPESFLRRL